MSSRLSGWKERCLTQPPASQDEGQRPPFHAFIIRAWYAIGDGGGVGQVSAVDVPLSVSVLPMRSLN